MTHVWLGPAGVPTVSKDRSTLGGIKTVSELGLNAFECEFVRGVKMNNDLAKECGKVSQELNIELSAHAPYFLNMSSVEKPKVEASKRMILETVERCHHMGAKVAVIHAGYYGKLSAEDTYKKIKEAAEDILKVMKTKGWDDVLLGMETTGKVSQWGTLEEIVRLCEEVKGIVPCLDPAHLFARNVGKIDYAKMFDKIKGLKLRHAHMHFSGMKWRPAKGGGGNEWYHLEIKSNKPPFEPLAKEIVKRKLDITIISESPVLEQDSLVMKKIFEKLGYKFD